MSLASELRNATAQALHDQHWKKQCHQTPLATGCVNASEHFDDARRLIQRVAEIVLDLQL